MYNRKGTLLEIILPIFTLYFEKFKVEEIYNFRINYEIYRNAEIFSYEETEELIGSKNSFEENVLLKKILSNKLSYEKNKVKYYNWIVKKWGKITKFEKTKSIIKVFFDQIKKGKIEAKYYNNISSYSKIASFRYPKEYFIYDSRVAYVLNWMLLKSKTEFLYFPIPEGRNNDLTKKYNMDTIISLFNDGKYMPKNVTYSVYCRLIKNINSKLNPLGDAFCIEMFLWGLFENIVLEIKKSVKIQIES